MPWPLTTGEQCRTYQAKSYCEMKSRRTRATDNAKLEDRRHPGLYGAHESSVLRNGTSQRFNCPSLAARPILYSKCRMARYPRCSTIVVNREFMARLTLADGQVPVLLAPNNGTCPRFLFRHSASPRTFSRCAT